MYLEGTNFCENCLGKICKHCETLFL